MSFSDQVLKLKTTPQSHLIKLTLYCLYEIPNTQQSIIKKKKQQLLIEGTSLGDVSHLKSACNRGRIHVAPGPTLPMRTILGLDQKQVQPVTLQGDLEARGW